MMDKKEKQILFSIEMVKAIIDGKKTMTRRVVKNIPLDAEFFGINYYGEFVFKTNIFDIEGKTFVIKPKYQVGDILYVKETWGEFNGKYFYRCDPLPLGIKWKSARYMPRKAARIFLKVTNLSVERLQKISEKEAIKEGVMLVYNHILYNSCLDSFMCLWHDLNAKRGHGWDENPYVWVIEFERIDNYEQN
jgi:hypothetical protein